MVKKYRIAFLDANALLYSLKPTHKAQSEVNFPAYLQSNQLFKVEVLESECSVDHDERVI